jgi:hypothetical protein
MGFHIALCTGLAWTAFHLPLMLLVDGAVEDVSMAYAIAMFGIGTTALSLPLAWLRLRTGSLWAVSLLHAAYNAAMYLVADSLTTDTSDTAWFAGESGVVRARHRRGSRPLVAPHRRAQPPPPHRSPAPTPPGDSMTYVAAPIGWSRTAGGTAKFWSKTLSGSYRALSRLSLVSVSPGKASWSRSGRSSVSKLV